MAVVGTLLMLSLHVLANAETCCGLEPQGEGGIQSIALLQTGSTPGNSVAAEKVEKEAGDESIVEEESTQQMATGQEAQIETQEQPIQAVEVVFPAPSIDTASFLQSDAPLALLATSPAHVFVVLLDHGPLDGSTNDDGEYVAEGVNFTEIKRTSLAPVKKVTGTLWAPPGVHISCPTNTLVCNGILYPNNFHQTDCHCLSSDGTSGHASAAFYDFPKKVIRAKIPHGLNSSDLDAAVSQIAHVANKEINQTLVMVDGQYLDAIESRWNCLERHGCGYWSGRHYMYVK